MPEPLRLRQLLEQLVESEIRFVLVGGLAVNAWGYVRATRDVDIVPDPSRENLARLDSLLKELGGKVDVNGRLLDSDAISPFLRTGDRTLVITDLGRVDVLQGLPQIPGFAVLATGTTSRRWKGAQGAGAEGLTAGGGTLSRLDVPLKARGFAFRSVRPFSMETITSEQPTVPAPTADPHLSMDEPVVPRRSPLRAAIKTGRPQEWIKNLFVFAGLLFSGKFDQPHEVLEATLTFVSFCLISSAGYYLNDLIDIDLDRKHPKKRFRPLPPASSPRPRRRRSRRRWPSSPSPLPSARSTGKSA